MAPRCIEIRPDAVHLPGVLAPDEQRGLAARCLAIGRGPAGWYVPRVRGGGLMRVRMVCLGRHWNARTYRYEGVRSDHDGRAVLPLPADLADLASRVAAVAGMRLVPDVCILNYYEAGGRMGLHQDKDERPETLDAGVPIVSLSTAPRWRRETGSSSAAAAGCAITAWRRSYRARGRAGLGFAGRFNLTFRQGAA